MKILRAFFLLFITTHTLSAQEKIVLSKIDHVLNIALILNSFYDGGLPWETSFDEGITHDMKAGLKKNHLYGSSTPAYPGFWWKDTEQNSGERYSSGIFRRIHRAHKLFKWCHRSVYKSRVYRQHQCQNWNCI